MKRNMLWILVLLVIVAVFSVFSLTGCKDVIGEGKEEAVEKSTEETAEKTEEATAEGEEPKIPEIPQVEVKWASLPYFDHSYAVIGVEGGFFEDAGIKIMPEPAGTVLTAESAVPTMLAGTVDVESGYAPAFMHSSIESPNLKVFAYANAFLGFAIMGQKEYKTVPELIEEGQDPQEAIKNAVLQMVGKKFAYPAETGPNAFIALAFKKAGITYDDLESIIVDDPKSIEMMIGNKVDFQCGGVPAHYTLLKQGFKEIIHSGTLAQYAEASSDSEELLAIGHAGWSSTDEWIDNNHDTMLRMSSVLYRIIDFMKDFPDDAFGIHVPYVNSIGGTEFTVEDGEALYAMNNFKTFEEQEPWYFDKTDPFYYSWNLEAVINLLIEQGAVEEGQLTADVVSLADDTYKELLSLKDSTDMAINEAEDLIAASEMDVKTAERLLSQAKDFYEWRNYLDSDRFASAAIEWAKFGG